MLSIFWFLVLRFLYERQDEGSLNIRLFREKRNIFWRCQLIYNIYKIYLRVSISLRLFYVTLKRLFFPRCHFIRNSCAFLRLLYVFSGHFSLFYTKCSYVQIIRFSLYYRVIIKEHNIYFRREARFQAPNARLSIERELFVLI